MEVSDWPVLEGMVNLSVVSADNARFIKCSPISMIKLDGLVQVPMLDHLGFRVWGLNLILPAPHLGFWVLGI